MSNWYADGLSFECTQCGNCCTGTPGYVWVSPREQNQIAALLSLSVDEFRQRYTRVVQDRVSLLERPGGDCILLTEERRCSIQEAKPRQCMMFPFWPRLIQSKYEWQKAGLRCPGIDNGARYLPQEIEAIADFTTPKEVIQSIFRRKRES